MTEAAQCEAVQLVRKKISGSNQVTGIAVDSELSTQTENPAVIKVVGEEDDTPLLTRNFDPVYCFSHRLPP